MFLHVQAESSDLRESPWQHLACLKAREILPKGHRLGLGHKRRGFEMTAERPGNRRDR